MLGHVLCLCSGDKRVVAVTNMCRMIRVGFAVFRTRWIPAAPPVQPQFSSVVTAAGAIILIAPCDVGENDSLLPNKRGVFSENDEMSCLSEGCVGLFQGVQHATDSDCMFTSALLCDNEGPASLATFLCHLSAHFSACSISLPVHSSLCLCCCHSV